MKTYDVYLLPDAIKDLEAIDEYISEQIGFPERAWTIHRKASEKMSRIRNGTTKRTTTERFNGKVKSLSSR